MESEGNQNKQIKPHMDANKEDTLVFGKALALVAVPVSLPGGPEIWYFGLQANTRVTCCYTAGILMSTECLWNKIIFTP